MAITDSFAQGPYFVAISGIFSICFNAGKIIKLGTAAEFLLSKRIIKS